MPGARTLVDRYLPRVARVYRRARDGWALRRLRPTRTPHGYVVFGDRGQVGYRVASGELERMAQLLRGCEVFIDVGANIGLYALLAATLHKRVVALEPHPGNLRCLLEGVAHNRVDGVEVLPVAVGRSMGVATLHGGGEGASLLAGWGGIASNYSQRTPVTTLDEVLGGRFEGRKLLVKIDVEGAELDVLRGAAGLLARKPAPAFLVEVGLTENFGGKLNPHFAEVFALFFQAGYRAAPLEAPERPVTATIVAAWVAAGKVEGGHLNYLFEAGK
jgi:FkbM family methyltransferase